VWNVRTNSELSTGKDLEGNDRRVIRYYTGICLEVMNKTGATSVRVRGVREKGVREKKRPSTSQLEPYC
jgi:hypothetical protein